MEEEICSIQKKRRDLCVDSLKVSGKEPVRDVVVLTPNDLLRKTQGKSVFKLSYRLINDGYLGVKDFENLTYFNDKVVSHQKGLSIGPNDNQELETEAILDIKDGDILVRVDAFSRIQEDDESNNDISTKLIFKGFQAGTAKDPFLHIEYLRIANRIPLQGHIKLTPKDSVGSKSGRVAFPVEYVIRNFGLRAATGFDNLFLLNGKRFFRQPKLTLEAGESRLVKLPVYFPVVNGKLTLRVDANMKYPKGIDCRQSIDTQLIFQGFNTAR